MPRHTPVLNDKTWPSVRSQVRGRSQVVRTTSVGRWLVMLVALGALLFL